jgi:NitT/TauT family transport system substrate-binding protein
MRAKLSFASWLFVVVALLFTSRGAAAEAIKIGLLKTAGNGGIFVALERGYFAAEGLTPTLTYFQAAQPIAVAARPR